MSKTIALIMLATMPSAGFAANSEAAPVGTVRYSDLDLKSDVGAATLRRRIDHAIVELSDDHSRPSGLVPQDPNLPSARATGQAQADRLIQNARRSG